MPVPGVSCCLPQPAFSATNCNTPRALLVSNGGTCTSGMRDLIHERFEGKGEPVVIRVPPVTRRGAQLDHRLPELQVGDESSREHAKRQVGAQSDLPSVAERHEVIRESQEVTLGVQRTTEVVVAGRTVEV